MKLKSGIDLSDPEQRAEWIQRVSNNARESGKQYSFFKGTQQQKTKRERSTILSAVRAMQLEANNIREDLFNGRKPVSFRRGYIPLPIDILLADDLNNTDKIIWAIIYRYNFTHQGAFPSQLTIANECNRNERSVRRSLIRLSNLGYIQIVLKRLTSGVFVNQYLLNIEDIRDVRK